MEFEDDRNQSQRRTHNHIIVGIDTFLSAVAVEKAFSVGVVKVNVMTVPGKRRRLGQRELPCPCLCSMSLLTQ